MRLDTDYWTGKFDPMTDEDSISVATAFIGETIFTREQKQILAQLLLCGVTAATTDEYMKVYEVAMIYNEMCTKETLFSCDFKGNIIMLRYDYRRLIASVPVAFTVETIKWLYRRFGYCAEGSDIEEIINDTNIYKCLFKQFKEDYGGKYIKCAMTKDLVQENINASYLNAFFLFNKIGLEGLNMYYIMAGMGTKFAPLAAYKVYDLTPEMDAACTDADKKSKGRVYVTMSQTEVVASLSC